MTLKFDALRRANIARLPQFKNKNGGLAHTKADGSDWSPAQWLQATVGELGEFANIRKKFERGDLTFEEYQVAAAKELADIQTYLDILAMRALDTKDAAHPTGVDLGQATIDKFNEVSERVGCDVRIEDSAAPAVAEQEPIEQVLRGALAWGMVYGPSLSGDQWEEMREVMARQFAARIAVPASQPAPPQQDPSKWTVTHNGKSVTAGTLAKAIKAGQSLRTDEEVRVAAENLMRAVDEELAQEPVAAQPQEAITVTDETIARLWDAQRQYHGGEPCKVGHVEFARAILALAASHAQPQEAGQARGLPRVWGVSRDASSPGEKTVLVAFERRLSDDELRALHEMLSVQPAPAVPAAEVVSDHAAGLYDELPVGTKLYLAAAPSAPAQEGGE